MRTYPDRVDGLGRLRGRLPHGLLALGLVLAEPDDLEERDGDEEEQRGEANQGEVPS